MPKLLTKSTRRSAPEEKVRIMVFGTFDVVHKGHVHFFRQARKLGKNPFLIVSVARDVNVKKIKGFKPLYNENNRLREVRGVNGVDKAVLGGSKAYIAHIAKERPNIIALGYDQQAYTEGLEEKLKEAGLEVKIVRLRAHQPHKYKSSIIKKKLRI